MTTFKRANWNKSTPAKHRLIGDALLILGNGLNGIVLTLPIDADVKVWIVAVCSFIITAGKFITKLFSNE